MSIPKYLSNKSPQKQGRQKEKKATQTINSGSIWFDKGDLNVKTTDETYCVDVKTVVSQKSYQLSLKDIDKFYKESSPKTPVFLIYIGGYIIKAIIQKE